MGNVGNDIASRVLERNDSKQVILSALSFWYGKEHIFLQEDFMNLKRQSGKRIFTAVLALLLVLTMAFPIAASASVKKFADTPSGIAGSGGGKQGDVYVRGFSIDINGTEEGGLYWLESEYDNWNWNPVYTGVTNGYSEDIPAVDDAGAQIAYNFNVYIDKNPRNVADGPFIVLYKNGEKVDLTGTVTVDGNEIAKIGAPVRGSADRTGNTVDPSGQSGRWTVPVTLTLEPGCDYEFAFLRGIQTNNGITCVVDKDGTGYLQNSFSPEEQEWYDEHKYDEFQYREYKYQTYIPSDKPGTQNIYKDAEHINPNEGTYHPMRFRFSTAPILAESVTLDKTEATLNDGETLELKATVAPENVTDKTVTWKSSDESVATVDANGKVTAVDAGTATITATSGDGAAFAECAITVNKLAESIELNKTESTIYKGKTDIIIATVIPENTTDKTVTWKSSDESVATVDENGIVTAVGRGEATITATSGDGNASADCKVTVKIPVVGDEDIMLALNIDDKNIEITDELAAAGITTKEEVIEVLYDVISEETGYEANAKNTAVIDVKLMISTDGGETWEEATKENFPEEGLTILLSYPEGTNGKDYDFTVAHMLTTAYGEYEAGDVEIPQVVETEDGLVMTVDSLSPFAISWQEAAKDNVVDADTDDVVKDIDDTAKTGDDMNLMLLAGLMLAAVIAAGAVFFTRKARQ